MTTLSREVNDVAHGEAPALNRAPSCSRHFPDTIGNRNGLSPQFAAAKSKARRFAACFPVRLRAVHVFVSVVAVRKGAVSCREQHYRSTGIPPVKSSDRTVGNLIPSSKLFSPTSPTLFGLTTLRLRSPLFVAAVFAPRSVISAANANGPAMQSRPSFPKSSSATACGTSKSVHGNSRRAF